MFTLLPSLFYVGVHFIRQFKTPYYEEQDDKEIVEEKEVEVIPEQLSTPVEIPETKPENHGLLSKINNDLNHKVKLPKKKSSRRRRKTSISELTHDDLVYLMKETGFTQEEIIIWYTDFLRDCPDGKLSKSKFIDIYQQFYQKGQVEKFCEHAFRLFNKDGSGYMDFIEFLLAVSLTSSKDRTRKIELFFSMYDMDRNGLIDGHEMRTVIESIYELMGIDISDPSRIDTKVHELFSRAECDQLGYLRKEQFAMACENDRYLRKFLKPNIKSTNNK